MKLLDAAMFISLFLTCVILGAGLVTERQRVQAQAVQIEVLEEQVNGLYLAAAWDIYFTEMDPALEAGVPAKRPRVTKPAGVGEGAL